MANDRLDVVIFGASGFSEYNDECLKTAYILLIVVLQNAIDETMSTGNLFMIDFSVCFAYL